MLKVKIRLLHRYPYVKPLKLRNGAAIEHPFRNARVRLFDNSLETARILGAKLTAAMQEDAGRARSDCTIYEVQHSQGQCADDLEWRPNYYFAASCGVLAHDLAATVRNRHVSGQCSAWSPFLSALRFNAWSRSGGVMLKGTSSADCASACKGTEIDGSRQKEVDLASADGMQLWIKTHLPNVDASALAAVEGAFPSAQSSCLSVCIFSCWKFLAEMQDFVVSNGVC